MKFFTSINPHDRLDIQINAMKTWIDNGYTIYSINSKEEILLLNKHTYIHFIETDDIIDKKYIRLQAVQKAISDTILDNNEICGIVNSDINISFCEDLSIKDDQAFIGVRTDLYPNDKRERFVFGFDVFIFHKKDFKFEIPEFLALGLPWWDFYIPFIFIKKNFKLITNLNSSFVHLYHVQRYSDEVWIDIGNKFKHYVSYIDSTLFKEIDIYRYVGEVKSFIDSKLVNK